MIFDQCFNKPINLPENLTCLTFGYYFNQPNVVLPKGLTHLTFWKHQKDLQVQYKNKIIKVQDLPIIIYCLQ